MLRIEQADTRRSHGHWHVDWRVINPDAQPIEILSAWLPHGGFRSSERQLDPPLFIQPGGEAVLESELSCPDTPGTVVQNAFLILRLNDQRVFARLRVTIQPDGTPLAFTETVTSRLTANGRQ